MAKDLVRTRQYVKKFIMMKANIQAVSLKVQTLKSQDAMAHAMKGVTRAMGNMNRQLNLPQIQKIMQEFEKQSEIMDMKEEMMDDAIDDAIGDVGEEQETEAVVQQVCLLQLPVNILYILFKLLFKVLDELGIQMGEELANLPAADSALGNKTAAKQPQAAAAMSDIDADLQARLENLRRE